MKDSYHVVFNKGGITKLQKTLPKSLGPGEYIPSPYEEPLSSIHAMVGAE